MALHKIRSPRFLLTNDDGVDAPGIAALRNLASRFGEHVTVAPSEERSGCGHHTTTNRDLAIRQHGDGIYSTDGTPADCTRVGLHELADGVEWVLSGINNGGNLGVDLFYSGTVAAAREAVFNGVPAIALSHYHKRPLAEADWLRAVDWLEPVVRDLLARGLPPSHYWNVNLPNPDHVTGRPELVECTVDPSPVPPRFTSDDGRVQLRWASPYSERPRVPGSDVDVCFGGRIAVSRVNVFGT